MRLWVVPEVETSEPAPSTSDAPTTSSVAKRPREDTEK